MIRLDHPLPGATLTDRFGWRAGIQTPNGWVPPQLHNGQDYAAPAGSVIQAAHAGRVTYVGWDNAGGGWMVKISSARITTMYLHMLTRSTHVSPGREVRAGQEIGLVGSTGLSTGPHLHFILVLNGATVDPLPYITSSLPPKPTNKEEDEMWKPTVHARTGTPTAEWMLAHPDIGADLAPGKTRPDGNVTVNRGYMVTESPSIARAWARMYAKGIGSETTRTNRAQYIEIQSEARRVAVALAK